ncbi:MAG: N-acetylglucosamine-6-phosphate deacetylase [Acidimicrobiia bacterium]|nr:N-acetylglucosamine-6-phosphate deacetylase [Acidimicrobiia bacterium]
MARRRLGASACVVEGSVVPGDVVVDDGRVVEVAAWPPGRRGGTACAGFLDVQVNGLAGVDFGDTDEDGYGHAASVLASTGVTGWLPTLPTSPPDRYPPALALAGAVVRTPPPGARILGVHLEGPFLSERRAGAHPVAHLRAPDIDAAAAFLAAGPVALVTLAPELDGALELVRYLVGRGVAVSLGHTDCDGLTAHAAFDAGARAVTHLWNAQRPMTGRDAAVGGAALARGDVFVGVIADLAHVGADTLRVSAAAAGDRLVVVTDAVWAAGLGEGEHRRPGASLVVGGGAARLLDGTLAGGTGTLDAAVRNLVSVGLPLERAVAAVTEAPARLLGRADIGRLEPGARADVVVLDDELEVAQVLVGGQELPTS